MKCFIFQENSTTFPGICGSSTINDLISHLQRSGVTRIFCDSEVDHPEVISCSFESVKDQLATGWLAAYSGCISRQSPKELRHRTLTAGADVGISLACSGKPWEHTTVLTDGMGCIEKTEKNPSPENTETNLCFSNLVWVQTDKFDPGKPMTEKVSAFLLPGYWRCQNSRENFLVTIHEIMCGEVIPWPHLDIPETGIILNSPIPEDTEIKGTLWLEKNCIIQSGCVLENCVILSGSKIGRNSNLRNCLVMPGIKIPEGTTRHDKYLSFPGVDNDKTN